VKKDIVLWIVPASRASNDEFLKEMHAFLKKMRETRIPYYVVVTMVDTDSSAFEKIKNNLGLDDSMIGAVENYHEKNRESRDFDLEDKYLNVLEDCLRTAEIGLNLQRPVSLLKKLHLDNVNPVYIFLGFLVAIVFGLFGYVFSVLAQKAAV